MGGQSFMPVDDADTVGPTSDPTLELFRLFWILLPAVPELAQGCSLVTEVAGCGIELHGFSLEVHGSFQVFYFHLLSSSYFPTQSSSEDKALSGLRRSCGISLLAGAASSLSGIVGGNVRSLFSTIIPKAVSKHWTGIHWMYTLVLLKRIHNLNSRDKLIARRIKVMYPENLFYYYNHRFLFWFFAL